MYKEGNFYLWDWADFNSYLHIVYYPKNLLKHADEDYLVGDVLAGCGLTLGHGSTMT